MFFHTFKRNENRILISLRAFQTILITCTQLKEILLTSTSRLRIIEKIWLPFQCIKRSVSFSVYINEFESEDYEVSFL